MVPGGDPRAGAVEADRTPPSVEIRYPPEGQRVHMADALVAECSDNASLASAELLVDGAPAGVNADLNLKPGRVVLPLLARTWAPGEHTVALQVTDVAGNSTRSEPVTLTVGSEPPPRRVDTSARCACSTASPGARTTASSPRS